ncbi:hypothetical protein [Fodinicola acaciae]|uniref:hypothetical protein n=1 Tax=Fodinicola acaciae TaxID=2681555 RepID=UPI0013D69190|nr:hypothetical protein [Fodinicola acaciae]
MTRSRPPDAWDPELVRLTGTSERTPIASVRDERYLIGLSNANVANWFLNHPRALYWLIGGPLVAALLIGWIVIVLVATGII